MKQHLRYFAFSSCLFLGYAPQQKAAAPVSKGEVLVLTLQKPVVLGAVTLTLERIEDSRCPLNTMCIWAGVAEAHVQLQDSSGQRVQKVLHLGPKIPGAENGGVPVRGNEQVVLGSTTYALVLTDVSPYPDVTDLMPKEKKVKVSLRAL